MDINTIKAIAFDAISDEIIHAYETEDLKEYFLAFSDGVAMLALKLIKNIEDEKRLIQHS